MVGNQQVPIDITRDIARLRRRVDEIETLVVRTAAVLGSLGVVLGAFLPLASSEDASDTLIQVPAEFLGSSDEGGPRGEEWLLVLGISGLLVVLLGCVWVFARAWGRRGTERTARTGGTIAVLAAVGTGVVLIMWAAAAMRADMSGGPAAGFLVVGVLLALVLTKTEGGRRLWVDREVPGTRR